MLHYFALKQREYPKKINKHVIALILLLFEFTYYFSMPTICKLNAATVNDYCYKFTLNVNKTTTGESEPYYPVLLENVDMTNWQSNNYIDKFGWSAYAYQGSLATEHDIFYQDINSVSSNQWYIFPTIQPNSNQMTILLGAADKQRNQGMYFFQTDYGFISNHNDFNVSKFDLSVEIQDLSTSLTASTHTLIDKFDDQNNTGFKLEYIRNSSGTQSGVKCTVGDGVSAYSSEKLHTNTNLNILFNCIFNGSTIQTSVNNGIPSVSSGTMATNTQDVRIGTNFDTTLSLNSNYFSTGIIRLINFKEYTSATLSESKAMYGFNPNNITQTSASNPNYAGTVNDISGSVNSHNLVYNFVRSQTGLSVNASEITQSASSGSTIFTRSMADIAGRWYGSSNPSNKVVGNSNFFGNSFLAPPSNMNMPDNAWYSLWLSAFGLVFAFGIWWLFKSVPISLFGASVPLVIGAIQGMLAPEFIIIWFLLFLGLYSSYQWYERS